MRQRVVGALDSIGRVQTAWGGIKVAMTTLIPGLFAGAVAWWEGAFWWQRILVASNAWLVCLVLIYFAIKLLDRYGSTAEVTFVVESWNEAKLHVTNRGPQADFFGSLWFQGQGTGGRPTLFAHWGNGAKYRVPIARGQTRTITLGRVEEEPGGIRRWNFFAMSEHDTLERVKPLKFYRHSDPVGGDAHASVLVQVFAEPDLERPVRDTRVVFGNDTAYVA